MPEWTKWSILELYTQISCWARKYTSTADFLEKKGKKPVTTKRGLLNMVLELLFFFYIMS